MSNVNPCFSEDIWFEILKNLRVKTLGKCRCVCKSWHSLVVSPSFMASHLKHYTQNDKNTLFLYRDMTTEIPRHEQYRFFLDSGCIPFQLSHTSICPFKVHLSFFVGSIHGLLCLSDGPCLYFKSKIMLWNPFLSKIINLPMSMVVNRLELTSVLGFGYNSNKNDHRVVKITLNRFMSCNNENKPLVEVYSVCDRIWRTIPANYLLDKSIRYVLSSHCFVNGVIHWLTRGDEICSIGEQILSFDIVEETFRIIEFPKTILFKNRSEDKLGIFEYQSELAVSNCEYDGEGFARSENCEIWVRRDECWCMILRVVVGSFSLKAPVEYLGRNGNLFGFARRSNKMLYLCDTKTNHFSELGYCRNKSSKFAAFTESLVLLDQNTT